MLHGHKWAQNGRSSGVSAQKRPRRGQKRPRRGRKGQDMTNLEQAQREYAIATKRERAAAQRYCACGKPMTKRGQFLLDLAIRAAADRQVAMAKLHEHERLAGVAGTGGGGGIAGTAVGAVSPQLHQNGPSLHPWQRHTNTRPGGRGGKDGRLGERF